MRKLVVQAMLTLDGVMQAPGGPEEDPTGATYRRAGALQTGSFAFDGPTEAGQKRREAMQS